MLNMMAIGNLGADAEIKVVNGKEYLSFRIAHTEKFTKADGTEIEDTTWISCISSSFIKVKDYLRKGQKVFVQGEAKVKAVFRPKQRDYIAGININVRSLELCGAKPKQDIPSSLFDEEGISHEVRAIAYIEDGEAKVFAYVEDYKDRGGELVDSHLTKWVVDMDGRASIKVEQANG